MAEPGPIARLPNEMLLNIASSLPSTDLPQFALVARKFGEFANDTLYRHIEIDDNKGHPLKLQALLRTLLGRPDLCSKVRSLVIDISIDSLKCHRHRCRPSVTTPYSQENIHTLASAIIKSWKTMPWGHDLQWERSMKEGVHCAYVDVLLLLVPNLTHLDLDKEEDLSQPPVHSYLGLAHVEGANQAIVAHFRDMRTLFVPFEYFTRTMQVSPQLTKLGLHWGNLEGWKAMKDAGWALQLDLRLRHLELEIDLDIYVSDLLQDQRDTTQWFVQ